MIKRAALALLLLSACAPEAAPPKEPEAPVVEAPVAPAVAAGDAAKYKAAPAGEIYFRNRSLGRTEAFTIPTGTAAVDHTISVVDAWTSR